jgi:hypothetical protein
MRRVVIILMFLLVYCGACLAIYKMRGKDVPALEAVSQVKTVENISDSVHSYSANDIKSGCEAEDKIFCAIERTVKCTLAPELEGCVANVVPSFVIGKVEEEVRPTEISFAITKIKPITGTNDISVYTKSDCNASWFGLCKGNVIYSLSNKDGEWVVTNIYALEM